MSRTDQRPARRRRGDVSQLVTILWRDIPAQVTATVAGSTEKVVLEPRYQKAIDKAAAVAGLTERHRYIEQWRRETRELADDADPAAAVAEAIEEIDRTHDRTTLAALVRNGGLHGDGETA